MSNVISQPPFLHQTGFTHQQPFTHQQVFTSTLHKQIHNSPINLWIVMVTATFFFLILSVYNFVISLYNYIFNFNDQKRDALTNSLLSSFGFVLFWGVLAILFYFFLYNMGYLFSGKTPTEHPLSRDETGDVSRDFTQI